MSTILRDQLYELYTARIYPVLVDNDPEYQRCMAEAGLGLRPKTIPPACRDSFEQQMRLQSWYAVRRIVDARSLDVATIRAKLLTGPSVLYRITQNGIASPPGIWWFTEKVAQRCRDEAGRDPQKRLDWLREVLAVCFNWSRFDRIETFRLHLGESIPVVIGRGLAMPYYKFDPYIDKTTGDRVIDHLPQDYWKKKGEWLLGDELQLVLPWIPSRRITPTTCL